MAVIVTVAQLGSVHDTLTKNHPLKQNGKRKLSFFDKDLVVGPILKSNIKIALNFEFQYELKHKLR